MNSEKYSEFLKFKSKLKELYEKNKLNKELARVYKHFLKSSDDDLYLYYALLKILKRHPIISEENINFLVVTEFLEKKEKKGR